MRCSTASTTTSRATSWSTAAHRIWFTDPRHAVIPFGPAIFPFLDHCSVLRLERNDRRAWVATRDHLRHRFAPRGAAVARREDALCRGRRTAAGAAARAARLSASAPTARVDHPAVLHTFGADHRGAASRDRGHVPRCGGQHRRVRRMASQRPGAADLCVLAAGRGDREPSVSRRLPTIAAVSAAPILIRSTSPPAAGSSIAPRPIGRAGIDAKRST